MTDRLKAHYLSLLTFCGQTGWPYCTGRPIRACDACDDDTDGPSAWVMEAYIAVDTGRDYYATVLCSVCARKALNYRAGLLKARNSAAIKMLWLEPMGVYDSEVQDQLPEAAAPGG